MSLKEILYKSSFIRNLTYKIKLDRANRKRWINGNNIRIENEGRLYKVTQKIIGDNNTLSIGKYTTIANTRIVIVGNNNSIKIGNGCGFEGGVLWIEGSNNEIILEDKVKVMNASFAAIEDNQSIHVGSDSLFSYDVEIRTSDSHSIIDTTTNRRINKPGSITIGRHVWIGAKSSILKGTTIGDNSIIGTRSIVTKDIPANSIAAGSPARVIKENVNWSHEHLNE